MTVPDRVDREAPERLESSAGVIAPHLLHALRNRLSPAALRLDVALLRPSASLELLGDVRVARDAVHAAQALLTAWNALEGGGTHRVALEATCLPLERWQQDLVVLAHALVPGIQVQVTGDDLPLGPPVASGALLQLVCLTLVAHDAQRARALHVQVAWRDRLLRCTWTVELGEASESDSARERETTALRVLLERTLQQTDGTLTRCDGAGGGLDVGVEWPVADAAVPPLSPGGAATGDVTVETSPFSVLCVDDNPALLDALERRLQLAPQCRELRRAQDRISTLAALNARVPDVVLLDLQLSRGGDGELLLTEMLDRMPTLPVVIFAGRATGRQIRRLLSRGAAAFVSKGVAPAVLLDVLTRVVRGERQVIADDA